MEESKQPLTYDKDKIVPRSARAGESLAQSIKKSGPDSKQLALDLGKVKNMNNEATPRGAIDMEGSRS
jgi:hypothetical protein